MEMAKRSLGITIQIGTTLIGELTEIPAPEETAEEIDITTLDVVDGYRRFLQGWKDGGTVDLVGYYYPNDDGQIALKSAFDSGELVAVTVTFPSALGTTATYNAIVNKYKAGNATIDDPLGFEASLRVSGKVAWGSTPSTGASAISFTNGSDIALTNFDITPAFAIDSYRYTATFDTDTEYKINVTATSHTIILYKNDVFVEELTSATSSTAITMSADEVHDLKVVVYELGKTPKTYYISIARTV